MHIWSCGASLSRHTLAGKTLNSKFQPFFWGPTLSSYNIPSCLGAGKSAQDRLDSMPSCCLCSNETLGESKLSCVYSQSQSWQCWNSECHLRLNGRWALNKDEIASIFSSLNTGEPRTSPWRQRTHKRWSLCPPPPLTPWVMVRDCAEPFAKQGIASQPVLLLSSEDTGFNFYTIIFNHLIIIHLGECDPLAELHSVWLGSVIYKDI